MRIYKTALLPHSLYVDEVSIGYNAYIIETSGKDEHGKFMPLWFEAFGEYKLPVYIYSVSLTQRLFGKKWRKGAVTFFLLFPFVFIFQLVELDIGGKILLFQGIYMSFAFFGFIKMVLYLLKR